MSGKRSTLAYLLALLALLAVPGACDDSEHEATCPDIPGTLCTWAGTGVAGFDGDGAPIAESRLYWPIDVTFTSSGDAYVLDWNNHRVRRVNDDGTFETVIGTDFVGDGPPGATDLMPPGAPGTEIDLNHPTHMVELPDGTLLLVAWHNHKLRHYDPATGLVVVSCGRGAGYMGDDGPAADALLNQPAGAAVAADGSIYILDQRNQRVRKIGADGIITTVAGDGMPGFAGDGGPPLMAQFSLPKGPNPQPAGTLALDPSGVLYVSDTLNHRVRRIDFAMDVIDTVAGNGTAAFAGDGGPGTEASLNNPRDLTVGPDGRLYVADELNHAVRAIDLSTGIITSVAGNGTAGDEGDRGPADLALLNRPTGVSFDSAGNLYIADSHNHRVRRILGQGAL